jgi:hypothetical protein
MSEIARVFSQLDGRSAVRIEGGCTSETYEVGERIVRLARTPYAEETLRRQVMVLPKLTFDNDVPLEEFVVIGYQEDDTRRSARLHEIRAWLRMRAGASQQ